MLLLWLFFITRRLLGLLSSSGGSSFSSSSSSRSRIRWFLLRTGCSTIGLCCGSSSGCFGLLLVTTRLPERSATLHKRLIYCHRSTIETTYRLGLLFRTNGLFILLSRGLALLSLRRLGLGNFNIDLATLELLFVQLGTSCFRFRSCFKRNKTVAKGTTTVLNNGGFRTIRGT